MNCTICRYSGNASFGNIARQYAFTCAACVATAAAINGFIMVVIGAESLSTGFISAASSSISLCSIHTANHILDENHCVRAENEKVTVGEATRDLITLLVISISLTCFGSKLLTKSFPSLTDTFGYTLVSLFGIGIAEALVSSE